MNPKLTPLTNSFHNRTIYTSRTRAEIDEILDTMPIDRTASERAWVKRAANALCGVRGCTCGRNEIRERA